MKILHLNAREKTGGAARAAHRLYTGQRALGLDARMAVLRRQSQDPNVILVEMSRPERWLHRWALRRERPISSIGTPWTAGRASAPVARYAAHFQPDITHLHWLGEGLLSVEALAGLTKPLVWTLHDQWILTGGCHYTGGCTGYQRRCGACPQLRSSDENDLSRAVWSRKQRAWDSLPLTLVAPSRWMAEAVRASSLFANHRVEVIPNGIDTEVYRPYDKTFAREVLGLPANKPLLLFGATQVDDPRKGLHHLEVALARLVDVAGLELVMFGAGQAIPAVTLPVHTIGALNDDRLLALLYSAVDVLAVPSVEDNLPNTVMEAMACATPCVSFNIGGLSDLIDHRVNSYLAEPFSPDDFAAGVGWALSDSGRLAGKLARESSVVRYSLPTVAAQHQALYHDLLQQHKERKRP
ncbi:MAG: glycosyltransferase family 4 protein [Anaerolineae bacterium]|nr:glycosyltransferase family 4 protein [Anaerolineae bacterium]